MTPNTTPSVDETAPDADDERPVTPKQALPNGFQVQIDVRATVVPGGRHIVGGSPLRVLSLSAAATEMIDPDGRILVSSPATASLARTLLDAGVAHPRPMFGPTESDVTVVIPVRDNQIGIDRLMSALHGVRIIVVDDGSRVPVSADGAEVIRTERSAGPAAARNLGAARVLTDFVAFLDSDVTPGSDWLPRLLGHFSDEQVAMVAPRITAMRPDGGPMARYEALHSSLDMGRREGPVAPGTRIAYVPSAAMILRRSAFDGFDESLQVAEDVDLCWRLRSDGWVIRYDPVALAEHDHRAALRAGLDRRRYYGTGAALLTDRHQTLASPMVMNTPMMVAMVAALTRSRWGFGLMVAMIGFIAHRLHQRIAHIPDAPRVAARLTAQSVGFGFLQMASALCRHYWPLSILLALVSRRFRSVLLAVALAEGVVEWMRSEMLNPDAPVRLGVTRFVAIKRLDDLAYGTGLWQGAVTGRNLGALRPVIGRWGSAALPSSAAGRRPPE
ncbi:mycofactocin biosynthesis glycosyltransferase MftF [Williamsia sp.]|uniref:mycofactocin biosynthesis glycosyltransferase MftF n=1 Tax=Williamsia sp. TaxID=1872085 RepID=UPI001A348D01|nr:mycofactocin biosynthesis glycosyltransferase MftF [Williamsia sp.]MBJ7287705.1 mycofactocin biosynthesis glycosyltransferase MftF [Williamsia sp.]